MWGVIGFTTKTFKLVKNILPTAMSHWGLVKLSLSWLPSWYFWEAVVPFHTFCLVLLQRIQNCCMNFMKSISSRINNWCWLGSKLLMHKSSQRHRLKLQVYFLVSLQLVLNWRKKLEIYVVGEKLILIFIRSFAVVYSKVIC